MAPSRSARPRAEGGYLVVEAAVAIPLYMMFILVILQISSWAIAQAKIAVAVNSTAMEISQYAYVRDDSLHFGGDIDNVVDALNSLSSGLGGGGDIFGVNGSENPLAQMVASSGGDRAIARDLLRKHLKESDASLAAMGVVGGASGVDLTDKTTIFSGDRIVLDAEYQLQVTFFWDLTLDMRAHATTGRWGNG
jgi:hypothetical protein